VNVQSPCITYGQPETQLKAQKGLMKSLEAIGHDPADRLRAMALAAEYGKTLYTGVFYREPEPSPTYEAVATERQRVLTQTAPSKAKILDMFVPR
jgi:2-oxoglutarate/2-oxoacid ferredoxin oxidoreductase subunit beta